MKLNAAGWEEVDHFARDRDRHDTPGAERASKPDSRVSLPAPPAQRRIPLWTEPLLAAFWPQVVVSQHGVDTHFEDPLAHLLVSVDGQRMAFEAIHRWAHRYADGRWIAMGGGGYEWVDVVPRAWTHLLAIAAGQPIAPESPIPEAFSDFVRESLGRQAPGRMTDGRQPWPKPFDQGFAADDPVDAAILATRSAVFPEWGLQAAPELWF